MAYIQTSKDKKKVFRTGMQVIILALIAVVVIRTMFVFSTYKPYDVSNVSDSKETGFIALSYFGVAREATDKLIATDVLKEHLQALYDQGYVTITPQDIINYYQKDQNLPPKSLFLIFEDGRKDTAIFAQKILEEFNYCATILAYGDNLINEDSKFLSMGQLKELQDNSYFQLGSNGYRLSYINAFDRYQNYIGELNSTEFAGVSKYLDRDYNHYAMDYLRDENRVAKESLSEMDDRITKDYQQLDDIYKKGLGEMPLVHILQHSNTGQFGTNDNASKVNERNIKELFKINFNREGACFNTAKTSIYDLTRMQPQSYWTTNHLLMRIQADTKVAIPFIVGNRKEQEDLVISKGAGYFYEEGISLTTTPKQAATMQVTNKPIEDISMTTTLRGNKAGAQTIYLRSDKECNTAIYVELANDTIVVGEVMAGTRTSLQEVFLPVVVDKIEYQTLTKNNIEAQTEVLNTRIKSGISATKEQESLQKIEELSKQQGVGTDKYIPTIDLKEAQARQLEIVLSKDTLSINVDGKEICKDIKVTIVNSGDAFVQARWLEYAYSQRNLADDVYDGVFEKIVVKNKENTIFDTQLHGFDKMKYQTTKYFDRVLNWFIETL